MAFWGRLALGFACFVVAPLGASATTPGYPPQILEVGADRVNSGEAGPFQGGCPWDPASGVRGTAFVSICQADPLEPKPPYEVVRSRSPFRTMQVVLEDTANYLREPAISPNGRWIAFDSFSPAGTPELDLVGVDGSGRRVLAGAHYAPVWASDSRRILARNAATGALDLINLSGRSRRFALGTSAAWQPRGKLVAFQGPGGRLIVERDDGRKRRALGPVQSDSIVWSPDGRLLAFNADSDKFASGLATWNVRTGHTRLLSAHASGRAAWSPDGRRLAVVSSPSTTSVGYALYVVPRNGGHSRPVFEPGSRSILHVDWVRNGRIVFVLGS